MSRFTMYQLEKNSCNKRRNFKMSVEEKKGDAYYKAGAVKRAAKAMIKGASLEEVEEAMKEDFADIPYQDQQRELLLSDSLNEIKRYLDWEKRPLMEAVNTVLDIYGLMEVEVTPDFVVADANPVIETIKDKKTQKFTKVNVADGMIEVIKLKTKKPDPIKDTEVDIGLLSMLFYGRKFYRAGRLKIKASYYYLRRTDDSYGEYPSFKDFDNKQIRSIEEIYEGKENATDEKFRPIVDDFVNGHEEEDCTPKDCENCILYEVCKGYTEAPVSIDREFKTKASDIKLNPLQKEAVEY